MKVSILVPTFNRSNLLRDCLRSIINQSYKNIEIIVINDASPDNTDSVIDEFNDARIKYFKNKENQAKLYGDRAHFKRFYNELMTGDLFCYISDDDLLVFNDHIEKAVNLFKKYNDLSIVIGSQLSQFYDDEKKLTLLSTEEILTKVDNTDKNFYYFNLLPDGHYKSCDYLKYFSEQSTHFNICVSGMVFRKSKLNTIDFLNIKIPSKWQTGYEFIIPPILFGDIYFINKPCALVRVSPKNASFQLTQYDHYYDSLISVNNAFSYIFSESKVKNINKYRQKFLQSLTFAYLYNSIKILRYNKLTLNSKSNIERYVNLKDILKFMIKFKFVINFITFCSAGLYLKNRFINFFSKKI